MSRLCALLPALAAIACVPTPSTTPDSGTTPTGGACPAEVAIVRVALCVETTAPEPEPPTTSGSSSYVQSWDASGAGTVAEVGGPLSPVAGSAVFGWFSACAAEHTQQVRWVDEAGETWTVGWGIDGGLDDGSLDGVAVGDEIDFRVHFAWQFYSSERGVVLSDADGPVFLYETTGALTDAERGGVGVEVDRDDVCTTDDPVEGEAEQYLVTFTGTAGPVSLRSGQQATVATASRDLDFTVGGAYWYTDCADGCGEELWTAWETP